MSKQGQHRVSITYLDQFSFRDKNNHRKICVYERGNPITQLKNIKSFTKENNIFDLRYYTGATRTLFEDNCQKIETHYPSFLKSLYNNGFVDIDYKVMLSHFIPSLLCRGIPFRNEIKSLLKDDESRKLLFEEITMFETTKERFNSLTLLDPALDIDFQVNFVMICVMNFFSFIFSKFKYILLKNFDQRGCFTSDNPVIHERMGNYQWLIPFESEIYFPINRDYLLFLFNPKYKFDQPLRELPDNQINQIDDKVHDQITHKIFKNSYIFTISPFDMGKIDLRT